MNSVLNGIVTKPSMEGMGGRAQIVAVEKPYRFGVLYAGFLYL
jgi:hypothetical protein